MKVLPRSHMLSHTFHNNSSYVMEPVLPFLLRSLYSYDLLGEADFLRSGCSSIELEGEASFRGISRGGLPKDALSANEDIKVIGDEIQDKILFQRVSGSRRVFSPIRVAFDKSAVAHAGLLRDDERRQLASVTELGSSKEFKIKRSGQSRVRSAEVLEDFYEQNCDGQMSSSFAKKRCDELNKALRITHLGGAPQENARSSSETQHLCFSSKLSASVSKVDNFDLKGGRPKTIGFPSAAKKSRQRKQTQCIQVGVDTEDFSKCKVQNLSREGSPAEIALKALAMAMEKTFHGNFLSIERPDLVFGVSGSIHCRSC